jgi:hypothetical protein
VVVLARRDLAAAAGGTVTRSSLTRGLRLVAAAVVLYLVLVQPNHPQAMTPGALAVFPLELPVVLLALVAAGPGAAGRVLRVVLVAALMLIALLKLADYAMFMAFGRGFNPVSDLALAEAGVRLLAGSIGPLQAAGALLAASVAIGGVGWLVWWSTGVWTAVAPRRATARLSAAVAVVFALVATAEVGHAMRAWALPTVPPGAAFTARVGVERAGMAGRTLAELRAFREAAAEDPFADRPGLLAAIDRDVMVIFVESYGRTSFDTPYFAGTHLETLGRAEQRLEGLGLSMRSGFVAAPTRGGQSWLSHATFANGLRIDDQMRHGAALASGRRTLFHVAQATGFHTAAVMPQITLAWPEAALMGFDTVLAAQDLGYRGLPFNWVTMPDQFTLAALDRLLHPNDGDRPLFVQVALGSSHAPWVPVPDLIDWDTVGDGTIFNAMAASGDPPEVVWRDRERVREQYSLAVDYALRTVFDYAARHAEDAPLLFVLGDHQAAGFIALDERPDVAVHVIGPPHLVDLVADWGWTPGLVPPQDMRAVPMERMRDMILDAFTPRALLGSAG